MITSRARAFTLLGGAFIVGLAAGAVLMATFGKDGKRPGNRPECAVRNGRVCFWAEQLQLTKDQQDSLVAVYHVGEVQLDSLQKLIRPPMDSIYQTIRPRVDSVRSSIREMVRPLLTPVQREKYDSISRAMDENRRRDRDRNQPGGPPRDR